MTPHWGARRWWWTPSHPLGVKIRVIVSTPPRRRTSRARTTHHRRWTKSSIVTMGTRRRRVIVTVTHWVLMHWTRLSLFVHVWRIVRWTLTPRRGWWSTIIIRGAAVIHWISITMRRGHGVWPTSDLVMTPFPFRVVVMGTLRQ